MIENADWTVIERLQEGLPLCERPFARLAEGTGMSEGEFLARVRKLRAMGVIRRLGPRLRHQRMGVRGNIMVVWRVPQERVDEVGKMLAAERCVSHCYVRPTFDGFPFNLYTMIHGPDMAAAARMVERLADRCGVRHYVMLPTVEELKKTTPQYRRPTGGTDADRQVG